MPDNPTPRRPAAGAALAFHRAVVLLAAHNPAATTAVDPSGIEWIDMPVPVPTMSGLHVPSSSTAAGALHRLSRAFWARGTPWSISVIGPVPEVVTDLAGDGGFVERREPTLTVGLQSEAFSTPTGPEYHLFVEDEEHRRQWTTTCETGFGLPAGTAGSILTPELMASGVVRPVLASRDGIPVATALAVLNGDGWLGLFCVATVAGARRSGVAERLVRSVLHRGRDWGAHTAYLRSTEMARPLYQGLGFVDSRDDTTYFIARSPEAQEVGRRPANPSGARDARSFPATGPAAEEPTSLGRARGAG
ncbi:GNAT family N-acetyltransferase [Kineococcus sp. GCM10028916]|uniref:GNAT family N-acetyltransferase n=1 Tax=Kineococcus sp. GCM10028916 TaxID=3273394 RepID=UPI003627505B